MWIAALFGATPLSASGTLASGVQRAGSQYVDLIEFRDNHDENRALWSDEFVDKAWEPAEQQLIGDYLSLIHQAAPSILLRAASYRNVTLHISAAASSPELETRTWADNPTTSVVFPRLLFYRDDYQPYTHRLIVHELAHLVDVRQVFSERREWVDMVQPRIDRARAELNRRGLSVGSAPPAELDQIGTDAGLPSIYAAQSFSEALAEYVARMVVDSQYRPPQDIEAYIRDKVLSVPSVKDPSIVEYLSGRELAAGGRPEEAIEAYGRSLSARPDFLAARRQRLALFLENGDLDGAIADLTEMIRFLPYDGKDVLIVGREALIKERNEMSERVLVDTALRWANAQRQLRSDASLGDAAECQAFYERGVVLPTEAELAEVCLERQFVMWRSEDASSELQRFGWRTQAGCVLCSRRRAICSESLGETQVGGPGGGAG